MKNKITFNSFREIIIYHIELYCKKNNLDLFEINFKEGYFAFHTYDNNVYDTIEFSEIYNKK